MNTIDILQYFTRDGRRRTLELNSTGIVAEKISRSGLTDDVLIFLQESSASRRGVSIDSRWVQSIGIVPHVDGKLGKVTIELHVDGPRIAFPQKGEPGAWKFTLEWVSNGDVIVDAFAWRISTYSIPWLKKQTSRSSAIGAWLKRETVLFKKEGLRGFVWVKVVV